MQQIQMQSDVLVSLSNGSSQLCPVMMSEMKNHVAALQCRACAHVLQVAKLPSTCLPILHPWQTAHRRKCAAHDVLGISQQMESDMQSNYRWPSPQSNCNIGTYIKSGSLNPTATSNTHTQTPGRLPIKPSSNHCSSAITGLKYSQQYATIAAV